MHHLMRRASVVLIGAAIGASILAAAAPALASTTPQVSPSAASAVQLSANWSGYYTEPSSGPLLAAVVNFTVPTVNCRDSRGSAPYYGAMWVGIGGRTDLGGNAWLEQTGVLVTCSSLNAKPIYQPFWEVVPARGVSDPSFNGGSVVFSDADGDASVQAGDQVQAQVFSPADSPDPGQGWYFGVVVNNGNGPISVWSHDQQLPQGVYTGHTAEVVTEYPKAHAYGGILASGFVDLGTVRYTQADYFSTGGSSFSIASHAIDLGDSAGQVAVYPGQPYTTQDSPAKNDSFDTYYAANWWE